ncbi:hypothetical protein BHE74_00043586 [Ensete ventricosum]|nr:hypothetical protein GW17_00035965 [Ensete ventricosum]RWW50179.1 hypothetical protein BHE74_00043586 [Ensete ventricosum]RZR99415.1 hypothetical protein BHM03_00028985 [Ensete ventricosum]
MNANMGCSHCRQRVSKVVSKMNAGLLEYMVDLSKKEVTVRGCVGHQKEQITSRTYYHSPNQQKNSTIWVSLD